MPDASPAARVASAIDWSVARDATVQRLQALIRFPSVNPPGGELPVAKYVAGVLQDAGIETQLLEPAPGRGLVVARLRGSGSAPPVMLVSHLDVVPADGQPWTTDPFGGELRDGFVYGRGAFDDKGMLAVHMECMLLLKQLVLDAGLTLERDVILLANADEEAGGTHGMGWLLENHAELVADAACAMNEGGRLRVVDGRLAYAAIQTAEKVQHVVVVSATGSSGHASVPLPDNAITRLARAISAIGSHREPLYLTTTVRRFFDGLATTWANANEADAMRQLASDAPDVVERAADVLAETPAFGAVLRAGVSPTRLAAGTADNVIPPEANATLNVRTLPGQSVDDVLERLRSVINDDEVTLTIASRGDESPESDADHELFAELSEALAELAPGVPVMPYLSTGATDSARLRREGVQCFGLLPFPLAPDDERRMHAADERLSVESIGFGMCLTLRTLLSLCLVKRA